MACGGDPDSAPQVVAQAETAAGTSGVNADAAERRERALRAARVWYQPRTPIALVNLGDNPPGPDAFRSTETVACRFLAEPVGGTTAKFNCRLASGEVVKVKYGAANAELASEVAASRLLSALGFGADRVYLVDRVRCAGCPPYPFQSLKCLAETSLGNGCMAGGLDYSRSRDFDPAVIERRFPGTAIEAVDGQGWAWFELDRIDPGAGGSPRAEVDALRLVAVLLAHWDNKAENQRLVCTIPLSADGSCAKPLALIQDLGGAFGPAKIDLRNWREYRVWSDPASCSVSMKTLPFGGATFADRRISEGGRTLLLGLLEQLSDQQLHDLFTGSRITGFDHVSAAGRDAGGWVAAFKDKVAQIRSAGPCPP